MLKINLGMWQLTMAGESMRRGREIMKATGCSLSKGLKRSWKAIKQFMKNMSTSFQEFKQKQELQKQHLKARLFIKNYNKMNKLGILGEDEEELLENALEKIAEIRGRTFYNNFMKWFVNNYDKAIEFIHTKGKYTFMDGIWCILDN